MELNESQKKAVKTIDKNVSVNAGAGSGKTRVLVERYLYILENGKLEEDKEIESIVAITFTKKASQEMKERIREEVRKRFSLDKKWRRIYRDLEKGNISTIHSFCSRILKENPVEANIDPKFNVLEDYKSDEILYEVANKVILKSIERDDKIYSFVRSFNIYNLDNLVYIIMDLYKKIRSTGLSFEKVKEITFKNLEGATFEEKDIFWIKNEFEYLMSKGRKNSKVCKLKKDPIWIDFSGRKKYEEDVVDMLPYLKENIGTMKGEEERILALTETIDNSLKIKEKIYKEMYEILIKLLIEIDKNFTKNKRILGYLDYEDLQLNVLKLLDDENIRKKYQNKFKYIMVDEFQDTNELQKQIIYKLASKESILDRQNLFIVGDPKQSIYAFRGADIEVFYEVMEDMKKVSKISPINLEENYRSLDTVIKFVNSLFEKVMKDKYVPLKPINKSKNEVDVEILENEDLELPDGESPSDYNKYYESRLIAKRIKSLVDEGKYDYGDFTMLFRSSTDDFLYEEALKEYGIPYYNLGGKGFFKQEEIIDLINGLKGIVNIYDNISIVGTLRSPMFGLSDRTIYWLLRQNEECLIEALNKDIPQIDEEELNKVKKAYEILNILILKRDLLSSYELLNELVEKTYYKETLLLKFGGKQRIANVYKFLEMARTYSEEENGNISDFINYIENMKRKDIEESQAKIESEEGNSVKIMTIHKSKGLEFKVVIIPQMAKKFNMDKSPILFDKKLGLGIKHSKSSPIYDEISNRLKEKEEEENKRILYVAMTRAEEKLILGNQGKEDGFKKFIGEFLDFVKYDLIRDLEIGTESIEEVKVFEEPIRDTKSFDKNIFPILGGLPGFNQKGFNSFSVSQYLTFKECKRKFYMNYYKKLSIDEYEGYTINNNVLLNPALKGEVVHKFCELYNGKVDKEKLLKNIVLSYGLKPTEEIAEEINPYIENYIYTYREDYEEMFSEKKFYYKLDSGIVNGIIDRIYIKDDNIEIIDFKTNKVNDKNFLIKKYSPQLQLYTKVCEDIYGLKVSSARLFLLETGELIDVDIRKKSLEENILNIKNFINYVIHNNNIENYKKKKRCNSYCSFNLVCGN